MCGFRAIDFPRSTPDELLAPSSTHRNRKTRVRSIVPPILKPPPGFSPCPLLPSAPLARFSLTQALPHDPVDPLVGSLLPHDSHEVVVRQLVVRRLPLLGDVGRGRHAGHRAGRGRDNSDGACSGCGEYTTDHTRK